MFSEFKLAYCDAQAAIVVDTAQSPLFPASASPAPTSSSGGVPLVYLIATGVGATIVTAVVTLLIWRHRSRTKALRKKVCTSAADLDTSHRFAVDVCCHEGLAVISIVIPLAVSSTRETSIGSEDGGEAIATVPNSS